MMFQPEHIELIRSGEKTQTRRDWDDDYAGPNVGSVVMATPSPLGPIVGHADCDCYIRIRRRWSEPLGAISTRTADAEGGYTVQGFKHLWEDLNGGFDPEQEAEVLEFEYVGYERPDSEFQTTIADGGQLDLHAADVVLARCELTHPMTPGALIHPPVEDHLFDGFSRVGTADIVASNAVEHETALDKLVGEVEDAVSTLHAEAEELRNRPAGGYGVDPHLKDVIEGLEHRAGELDNALERFLDDVAPPEREAEL